MQNCLDTVLTSLNRYKKKWKKHLQQAGIYGTWLKWSTPKSQYDQSTCDKDLYRLRELCTATLIGTKNLVPQLLQPTVS